MPELTVAVLTESAAWLALEPEYRELFAASPAASPPLRWEWLAAWWRLYGGSRPRCELRVLTVRQAGRLVGVLPLYLGPKTGCPLRVRRLGFLSTGEADHEMVCPEYLDLLAAAGQEQACLEALAPVLFGSQLRWHEFELFMVGDDSPWLAWLARPNAAHPRVFRRSRPCFLADLSGGFEAYLGRLPSKWRKRARRLAREIEREGLRFEVAADAEQAAAFYDQLAALHTARWEAQHEAGRFADPRFAAFHRELTQRLPQGEEVVLARLCDGPTPLAVIYGFRVGTKFDFYQSGVQVAAVDKVESPGLATILALMAWLCEQGVTTFDFLAGDADYKRRLGTLQRSLHRLRFVRLGLRSGASLGWELASKSLSKALARARARRDAAGPPAEAGQGPASG